MTTLFRPAEVSKRKSDAGRTLGIGKISKKNLAEKFGPLRIYQMF